MTITYDPQDPAYWDEPDLRQEMTRVFDLCHGCRMCFKLCPSFPSLFEMVDEFEDQDAGRLTAAQQNRVVDECFNCKLCYVICPYTPGQSEWELDFPRLMMRAEQVRHRNEHRSVKAKLTGQALGRTDLAGKANVALAPLANKAIGTPGSRTRKLMEKTIGIAAERVLPPYARQRFSTWFAKRSPAPVPALVSDRTDTAVLFPTCIVEYQAPQVGHDLVKVLEHNGVACTLPEGQVCCGAPWLHAGDVDAFVAQGRKNLTVLATALRAAGDDATVVVPQPTCSYILKKDYVDYIGGPDAELVAERTQDAAEYLMGLHKAVEGVPLDTVFTGEVPDGVTYHAPCHLRAQNIGLKSRDLIKLTGAKVTVVSECSGIDGTWGYREENYAAARQVAQKMATAITKADNEAVAGDCHLANGAIVQETGKQPTHPVQFLARAYGIPEEETPDMTALTLADIADVRAYEREREEFRTHVIALKKRRRVAVGPFVTLVFECRDTIRFQIQEMARIEKLISDEAIEAELAAYNPLLPDEDHLSATLFLELTSKEALMEWLPKLVGIESAIELQLGEGPDADRIPSIPEASHEAQLTRDDITASVHYIRFALDAAQARRFRQGPASVASVHPAYAHRTVFTDETRVSLADDLGGSDTTARD